MKRTLLILLVLWGYALAAQQDSTTITPTTLLLTEQNKTDLKAAQQRMLQCFSDGDAQLFLQIAGNDFVTINADGVMMDKAGSAAIVPGFQGSTYQIVSQEDRFYGNLAISTGRIKFYIKSILVADVLFTQGWIYRDGNWEYIHWQGTMTGTPAYYPQLMVLFLVALLVILIVIIRRWRKRRT